MPLFVLSWPTWFKEVMNKLTVAIDYNSTSQFELAKQVKKLDKSVEDLIKALVTENQASYTIVGVTNAPRPKPLPKGTKK